MQRATEILGTSTIFQKNIKNENVSKKDDAVFSSLLKKVDESVPKGSRHNNNDIYENIVFKKVVSESYSDKENIFRRFLTNGQYFQSLIASGVFVNQKFHLVTETKKLDTNYSNMCPVYQEACSLKVIENGMTIKSNNLSLHSESKSTVEQKQNVQDRTKSNAYSLATKSSQYQSRDFSLVLVKVVTHKDTLKLYVRDYRGNLSEAQIEQVRAKLSQSYFGDIDIKHNGTFRRLSGSTTSYWS